ncbi:Vesicle transport protein, Got1/SFT2-like [Dillenia turbinata]|uniref:Vesicle transport protein, Got1/SFT2-like n=1 Tax=Dillenia turbinata TaxID=194707 RepID=A0AAN8ZGV5_9MAGN
MVSFEMNDRKKIGIGLTGFGIFFSFLGILFLFDKGLLAMGNILFLSGVTLTIGLKSTIQFFMKPQNYKGTISFGVGFFLDKEKSLNNEANSTPMGLNKEEIEKLSIFLNTLTSSDVCSLAQGEPTTVIPPKLTLETFEPQPDTIKMPSELQSNQITPNIELETTRTKSPILVVYSRRKKPILYQQQVQLLESAPVGRNYQNREISCTFLLVSFCIFFTIEIIRTDSPGSKNCCLNMATCKKSHDGSQIKTPIEQKVFKTGKWYWIMNNYHLESKESIEASLVIWVAASEDDAAALFPSFDLATLSPTSFGTSYAQRYWHSGHSFSHWLFCPNVYMGKEIRLLGWHQRDVAGVSFLMGDAAFPLKLKGAGSYQNCFLHMRGGLGLLIRGKYKIIKFNKMEKSPVNKMFLGKEVVNRERFISGVHWVVTGAADQKLGSCPFKKYIKAEESFLLPIICIIHKLQVPLPGFFMGQHHQANQCPLSLEISNGVTVDLKRHGTAPYIIHKRNTYSIT